MTSLTDFGAGATKLLLTAIAAPLPMTAATNEQAIKLLRITDSLTKLMKQDAKRGECIVGRGAIASDPPKLLAQENRRGFRARHCKAL